MSNLEVPGKQSQSWTPPEEGAVEVHCCVYPVKAKEKPCNVIVNRMGGDANRPTGTAGPNGKTGSAGSSVPRLGTMDNASTGSEVGSSAGHACEDNDDGDENEPEDSEMSWTVRSSMFTVAHVGFDL
jgi:hypothetical protein